jgi:phage terminase large subunit GpA-like protein
VLDFGQHEHLAFADPGDLVARTFGEVRFPEKVLPAAAARRHRVLNNPGAYSGPWGEGPYFVEHLDRIMDACATESPYNEVGVMGPAQTGKSEIGNNVQLQRVIYDPTDMLFIGPDRVLIESYVKKEFDKMVEHTPALQERLLPGANSDTINLKRFRGAELFFYWPTGPRLRALPFSWIRVDDLDDVPTDIGDQGDIVSLARGRMGSFSAFGRTMLYVNSTPKLGQLAGIEAFVAGGTDERLYVDCRHCGEPFALYSDRLDFDRQGTPRDAATSASVICPECGGVHLQSDKRALLESYRWVGKGETAMSRRREVEGKVGELEPNVRAGFRLDGLFGFRPWSEMAQLLREAELKFEYEQDDGGLKAWDQTVAGRNYRPRSTSTDPVTDGDLQKRAKASSYVMGEVPPGVEVLIASIDQQGNRFEVSVWGFGPSFKAWLVDRFALHTIEENGRERPLSPFRKPEDWSVIHRKVMTRAYPLAGAPHLAMKIFNTVVDTGGLDNATNNAFTWWHAMVAGDVVSGRPPLPDTAMTLYKGGNNPKGKLLPPPTIDAKRQVPGALQAMMFIPNVNRMKDILDVRLNRKDDGPGYVSFPRDVPHVYLAELRAETKVGDQWVRPPHTANETMDLYVMAYTVVLRFGGGDASLGWVPSWARPPRGGPVRLPAAVQQKLEQAVSEAMSEPEPEPSPVQRIGRPVQPVKGGRIVARSARNGIRSVRSR